MTDLNQFLRDAPSAPPRKRRRVRGFITFVVVVAMLVAAAWVVDGAARGFAEDRVEDELANRLPSGSSDLEATIGGVAFLPQFFAASLDDLTVSFAVDGTALAALASPAGSTSELEVTGDGILYSGVVPVLGIELPYTVALEPSLEGDYLVLTPTSVTAVDPAVDVDITSFVNLADLEVRYCAAELLPQGMHMAKLSIEDSSVHLTVTGRGISTNIEELRKRGTCE